MAPTTANERSHQRKRYFWLSWSSLFFPFVLAALAAQGQPAPERPYVVLVSLDGFRHDYAALYGARHLQELGREGAVAPDGLIPSFPTLTFPNHLSIVTGMYPEHHGIVGNTFIDVPKNETFTQAKAVDEGSWLKAKPIWQLAEDQGLKAASMFWPMSDAKGLRPSYWKLFDDHFPNDERVRIVLDWLKLPAPERPHMITLYFSDVDHAGHDFGPDTPETRDAVLRLDALVGKLWEGIRATGLPVNLVVVSDHGMEAVKGSFDLRDLVDANKLRLVTLGPGALIYAPDAASANAAYRTLKQYPAKLGVYRRAETPPRWHFSENPLIGDLLVMSKGQVTVVTSATQRVGAGQHGLDPKYFHTMRGIFYAAGPNVRPGTRLQAFENVHVFPFLAEILGLTVPPGLDGSSTVLRKVLEH